MKHFRAIATLVAITVAGLDHVAAADTRPVSADEQAIRKVIGDMTAGFNSHSGRAASAMYLPDAKLTTARGEVMKGQAEIEKGLDAILPPGPRMPVTGPLTPP